MAGQHSTAVGAVLEYYRIKYPIKSDRIAALKSDYLALFESEQGDLGKTLQNTSADGQSAAWSVSMGTEEKLSVYATAIKQLAGRASDVIQLFSRN